MWKKLDIDDLRTILSEDEIERLLTISVDDEISSVVNDSIDMISDTWRGALAAKGRTIDVRDHYTPSEYRYWILVHARYAMWTRFPNAPDIALDKAREAEYKKALEILKDPFLDVVPPDYGDDPELSATVDKSSSIFVPPMRFLPWYLG